MVRATPFRRRTGDVRSGAPRLWGLRDRDLWGYAMTKMSSTMFSVGTLLRHAEDTSARVKVLVQGNWMEGRVLGCDGHGAVLEGGSSQFLVRLDQVSAVEFSREEIEQDADMAPRSHGRGSSEPIEAGPVTVPHQARGDQPTRMLHGFIGAPS